MAAIDFPSSPVNGQIFGNYTYDSGVGVWRATPQVASGLPAGTIVQWPGVTAPTSWLICDGSAVSRSTYASLFSAIGTTYGSGDGTTTFNLPNLKGRVAVGRDASQTEFDTLGEIGGAKTHTLLVSEMPSHTHVQDAHNHTQNSHNHTQDAHGHVVSANSFAGDRQIAVGPLGADGDKYSFTDSGNDASTSTANIYARNTTATNQAATATNNATTATNQNTGGGGAHNNLQPYIVLNYIIKTSAGVTAGDSELATRVGAIETTTVRSVALGGTGASTLTSGSYLKGAGTSAITAQAGIPAGDITSGALGIAYGGTGYTTGSGLVPVIPSSLQVNAGTASANANGKITFSGVTTLNINGIFSSSFTNYRFLADFTATTTANNMNWRLRSGGTDYSSALYYGWGWYLDYNSGGYDTGQSVIAATTGKLGYSYAGTGTMYMGDIIEPYLSTKPTGILNHQLNGGTMWWRGGFYNGTVSADGITFFFPNASSGIISFFGYRD